LALAITRGVVLGMMPNEVLIQCLWFFAVFAAIGYAIGSIAQRIVAESVEQRYRQELAAFQDKITKISQPDIEQ
jgi:hypothetical protein